MKPILDWLYTKNPGLTGDIPLDQDLIEARLVDSLDFLEFIYLLEEVSGRSIDLGAISVDDFRTLRRIRDSFLNTPSAA
jgi:acyl carrier protein